MSAKSQVLIVVVFFLISISIFLTFSDSQSLRLQLRSFPLSRPFPSNSSSSCPPPAVVRRRPPLKVFMYDLPRRFNFEMIDHQPDCEANRGVVPPWPDYNGVKVQHSVEYWMTASLMVKGSGGGEDEVEAVRVFDGDESEVFFVPFFSSLSFNTHGRTMTDPETEIDRRLQIDLLDFLRNSKHWQRSAGRDHLIPMHHPNAFQISQR